MIDERKCGCKKEKNEPIFTYCPDCGKYLLNIFLAEKYPSHLDEKISPFRILLKKLYNSKEAKGEINEIPHGADILKDIKDAIGASNICFFDITKTIFNVAFELGYSLARNKYVLVGCSEDDAIRGHFLSFMNIKKTINQSVEYLLAVNSIQMKEDIENLPNIEIRETIKACVTDLDETIFKIPFANKIEYTYGTDYGTKKPDKNLLILTDNNCIEYFNNIEKSKLSDHEVTNPNFVFADVNETRDLVENLHTDIAQRYDYLIVHLLGNESENIQDASMKNFKSGLIAGFMHGKKEGRYVYFIVHENNNASFSDIHPRPYSDQSQLSSIINDIIENRINQ